MPDQKLNLPLKMFAAIERLVKDTNVWDADLSLPVTTGEIDISMEATCGEIDFAIPAPVHDAKFGIDSTIHEVVENLTNPGIIDAEMERFEPRVIDEKVESIDTAAVHNESISMGTDAKVIDFFKRYNVQAKLPYVTSVKSLNIKNLKPQVYDITVDIAPGFHVKENLFLFRRMTVQHKPVELSFLSEKEQLVYWKWAVVQTKKEARKLQLVGVYPGVPYDYIENIKVNYSQRRLNYNFKTKALRSDSQLEDIALFTDLDTNKTIVVMAK